MKILLVDDEPSVRGVIGTLLRRAGHDLVSCQSPIEALDRARTESFDVAIVDYGMPEMHGVQLLTRLRKWQPTCGRILLSGTVDLPIALDAVNQAGVGLVLQKPIRSIELIAAVAEVARASQHLVDAWRRSEDERQKRERQMLLDCLRNGDIQLALQPIVTAKGTEVRAYEGLMRSRHFELRTPLEILRVAEEHDLVADVADVIVDLALARLQNMPEGPLLFLNVHPNELEGAEALLERLTRLQRFADRIVLELTERRSLAAIPNWRETIGSIRARGFAVALDDLGAGYNSLTTLADLEPEYIKLDMSLVRDIDRVASKRQLVELLCRFSEARGTLAVAEGVETAEEADLLRMVGANLLQGYYFGRPELR